MGGRGAAPLGAPRCPRSRTEGARRGASSEGPPAWWPSPQWKRGVVAKRRDKPKAHEEEKGEGHAATSHVLCSLSQHVVVVSQFVCRQRTRGTARRGGGGTSLGCSTAAAEGAQAATPPPSITARAGSKTCRSCRPLPAAKAAAAACQHAHCARATTTASSLLCRDDDHSPRAIIGTCAAPCPSSSLEKKAGGIAKKQPGGQACHPGGGPRAQGGRDRGLRGAPPCTFPRGGAPRRKKTHIGHPTRQAAAAGGGAAPCARAGGLRTPAAATASAASAHSKTSAAPTPGPAGRPALRPA